MKFKLKNLFSDTRDAKYSEWFPTSILKLQGARKKENPRKPKVKKERITEKYPMDQACEADEDAWCDDSGKSHHVEKDRI